MKTKKTVTLLGRKLGDTAWAIIIEKFPCGAMSYAIETYDESQIRNAEHVLTSEQQLELRQLLQADPN